MDKLKAVIKMGTFREYPSEQVKISSPLKGIVSQLLRKNPLLRPSIFELLKFRSVVEQAKKLKIVLPGSTANRPTETKK